MGLFPDLFVSLPGELAIIGGCLTDLFFEQAAERADAFEPHIVAYFGNGQGIPAQTLARLFDPFAGEVLVRGHPVDPGKKPMKMISGKTSLRGKPPEIDGFAEIPVDIQFGRDDPLIDVWCNRHACIKMDRLKFNSCFSHLYKNLSAQFWESIPVAIRNFTCFCTN